MKVSRSDAPQVQQQSPEGGSHVGARSQLRGMTYDQQLAAVQLKTTDPPAKPVAKIPLIVQGNTSTSDLTAATAATFGAEVGGLYQVTLSLADLYRVGQTKSYGAVALAKSKTVGARADIVEGPNGTITGAATTGFLLQGGATLENSTVTLGLAGNGLLCLARLARAVFNGLGSYGVAPAGDALDFKGQNFEVLGTLTMDNPIADVDARNHSFVGGLDLGRITPKVNSTYKHVAAAFMAAWGTIAKGKGVGLGTGQAGNIEAYRSMSGDTASAATNLNSALNALWVEGAGLDPTQRVTYVTSPFDITAPFLAAVDARDAFNATPGQVELETPWACVLPLMQAVLGGMKSGVDLTFIPAEYADFKTSFEANWKRQLNSALTDQSVWSKEASSKVLERLGHESSELTKDVTRSKSDGGRQAPQQAASPSTEGVIAN